MTKFKAGDLVTFMLDERGAVRFNEGGDTGFHVSEIINHEPAPDPIVGYVWFDEDSHIPFYGVSGKKIVRRGKDVLPKIKLTYCPATGKAEAEVIA